MTVFRDSKGKKKMKGKLSEPLEAEFMNNKMLLL